MADGGGDYLSGLFCGFSYLQLARGAIQFAKTLNLSNSFSAAYNAATAAIDIGLNNGTSGVKVRLPLALNSINTETSDGAGAIITGRLLVISDYLTNATSVTVYGAIGRASGGDTTVHMELYDETNSVSIASGSAATPAAQISLDCSSVIGAANALYTIRVWANAAGTNAISIVELRIS